jgi:hypothetical protein
MLVVLEFSHALAQSCVARHGCCNFCTQAEELLQLAELGGSCLGNLAKGLLR